MRAAKAFAKPVLVRQLAQSPKMWDGTGGRPKPWHNETSATLANLDYTPSVRRTFDVPLLSCAEVGLARSLNTCHAR